MKKEITQKEQIARINKALLFINANLSEKLDLSIVAKEAFFSPFYFHRIFKLVIGETVSNYIHRKKIEKSAEYLLYKKEFSIKEVSQILNFSSVSVFSRAFKNFYGISPEQFKKSSKNKFNQVKKIKGKNGKIEVTFKQYISNINKALNWINMNAKTIEVKELESINTAYVAYKGKMDDIKKAYNKLIAWGMQKGLMNNPNLKMITIYHDSPKISDPNNIGMSACVVLESLTSVDGEVGLKTIEAGKCIVSRFEIKPFEFQEAWENSFAWMIANNHKKNNDKDPFEIYYNNAENHPEGKFIVDFCIPIL